MENSKFIFLATTVEKDKNIVNGAILKPKHV